MSLGTRRLIVFILILAFTVSAPLVVMRTAGYRYNWKKGRPEMTGVVKFDSEPGGAAISLNGALQAAETPTSVFRLLPGEYEIKLEKPGYFEWAKTLAVRSGETTFTDKVILVARSTPENVRPGDLTAAAFSPDGEMAAALRPATGGGSDLVVIGANGKTETVLGSLASGRLTGAVLSWSSSADWLLLSDRLPDGNLRLRTYALYGGAQPAPEPVNELLPSRARIISAGWSADDERLVITTNVGVYLHDPATGGTRQVLAASGVNDAAIANGRGYAIRTTDGDAALIGFVLASIDMPTTLSTLPDGNYAFAEAGARYLLLIETGTNRGVLYDLGDGRLSDPLPGGHAAWQKTGQRGQALLWNEYEIYAFDPSDGSHELITRVDAPIVACAWHATGRLVYYATATGLAAIETDTRDRRNAYLLARDSEVLAADLENSSGAASFAGKYDGLAGLFIIGQ